jgi:ABC-type cobalamin/Fe3+-siderophores transport system ATPase subunit
MLVAEAVTVNGRGSVMLEPTSLSVEAGQRILVTGEPGHGHTALALVLAGRMLPDAGRVLIDGSDDLGALRRAVVLVDTPGVSDPDELLPLATVVGEELAMAGRPSLPRAAREWLSTYDVDYSRTLIEGLAPLLRTRILTELAVLRPGVRAVILTLPERHGGRPEGWWSLAGSLAERGLAVVVQSTEAPAQILGVPEIHLTRQGDVTLSRPVDPADRQPAPTSPNATE